MSERPQRQIHSEGCDSKHYAQYDSVYMKHKGEKLCNCGANDWNACIDAYEQWEKENPRLEEKRKIFFRNFTQSYPGDSGIGGNDPQEPSCDFTCYPDDVWKWIVKTFGQPKDAVSVDIKELCRLIHTETITDLTKTMGSISFAKYQVPFKPRTFDELYNDCNRKLKGQ